MANVPEKIAFHYLKSTQFRVVHVDGVIGSVTPGGNLHVAMFSERPAIPQRVVHSITPDGVLGETIPEEGFDRGGFVRELEVDAMFSLRTAKLVRDFLSNQIIQLEKALETIDEKKKAPK